MANREKRALSLIRKLLCGAAGCVVTSAAIFGSLKVQAAEVEKGGTITINMSEGDGEAITDAGTLFLYQVGTYNDTTKSFIETSTFDGTTPDFSEISVATLTAGLTIGDETYNDISKSETGRVGNRELGLAYSTAAGSNYIASIPVSGGGSYTFTVADDGLYLITYADNTAANGIISEMSPIVISVPNLEIGATEPTRNVTANPKPMKTQYAAVVPPPPPYYPPEEVTPPPTVPTPPSEGTVLGAVRDVVNTIAPPAVLGAQRLPQTGQLWWPVPILAVAGIALVAVGSFRRKSAVK